MNSKVIIGALVGAIILFFWQFLSWGISGLHSSEMQYTLKQDSIMKVLSENLDEGHYFLPNVPPGSGEAEYEQYKKDYENKPWAMVSYHKSMKTDMTMNMIRAFVADIFAVLVLIWLLVKIPDLTFSRTILTAIGVGFVGYLSVTYLNSIWFETPAWAALLDVVASWGLVGAWLGWWLRRGA
jgi:hypothetical protein